MKKSLLMFVIIFLVLGMLAFFPEISAENKNEIGSGNNLSAGNEIGSGNNSGNNENEIGVGVSHAAKIQAAIQTKNQLKFNDSEIPENCTKTGSVIRCELKQGKTMVVMAGNSGNTIIKIDGENISTKAQLYHHNGEIYGVFGNKTKLIEYLPEQLKEKIRERTRARLNNTNITLNENGNYEYAAKKQARFLGLFKVKEKVKWYIDAETGEILKEKVPWWGFLARDVEEEKSEDGSEEQVEFSQKCFQINLQCAGIIDNGDGTYDVTLKRLAGGEEIAGVMVVLLNATEGSTPEDFGTLGELQTKTETISGVLGATKLEYTAYFEDSSGNPVYCTTREYAGEFSQKCFQVNLQCVGVINTSSTNYDVTLKRLAGGEEIAGVMVVLLNATEGSTPEDFGTLGELQTKTETISGVLGATKLEYTAYFEDSSGNPVYCTTREYTFD